MADQLNLNFEKHGAFTVGTGDDQSIRLDVITNVGYSIHACTVHGITARQARILGAELIAVADLVDTK